MFSGCRRSDNLTIQARNMRPLENNLWNRPTFLHKHPDNLKVEITFQWKFFEKLFTSGHLARL